MFRFCAVIARNQINVLMGARKSTMHKSHRIVDGVTGCYSKTQPDAACIKGKHFSLQGLQVYAFFFIKHRSVTKTPT